MCDFVCVLFVVIVLKCTVVNYVIIISCIHLYYAYYLYAYYNNYVILHSSQSVLDQLYTRIHLMCTVMTWAVCYNYV